MVLKWKILHLSLLKSCKSPILTIAIGYATFQQGTRMSLATSPRECRVSRLRGAEKHDRGNPLHSQQHIFADWHTISDGVKMVDIAFELAQELQISHFNNSHRLCQSPQKQQRHPKKVPLCVELPGLEPRTTEPKSAVLPLHHSSDKCS